MKLIQLFLLMISSLLISGCVGLESAPTPSPSLTPQQNTVKQVSQQLKETSADIKTNTEQGKVKAPQAAEHWDAIDKDTADLDSMATRLDATVNELKASQHKIDLLTLERDKANKRAIAAEAKASSALHDKIQWLIIAGIAGLGICVALYLMGNKWAATIGIVLGSIVATAISLQVLLPFIPWAVGSLILLGIAYVVYEVFKKHRKLSEVLGQLEAVELEAVETVKVAK